MEVHGSEQEPVEYPTVGERLMLETDGVDRVWSVMRVTGDGDVVLKIAGFGTTQVPAACIDLEDARHRAMLADLDALR